MSGRILQHSVRTARAIRAVVTRPPYVPPGHFYSPLASGADVARALTWQDAPGVDLAEAAQLQLASRLAPDLAQPPAGPRYRAANSMYGPGDGSVYRALLRELRPARVVEIGSGYSTAIALDVADEPDGLPDLQVTCIEPDPERLLRLLGAADHGRVRLISKPVQDVPLAEFTVLRSGDIVFIDSTHVVKAGSDVVWLFLHVLPRLCPGVIVHVHDVFWPFEYPADWLRERRDWTESYLVHAFLSGNQQWEIVLFSSWLWNCHPELVPAQLAGEAPGSLWLRRRDQ